MSSIDSPNGRAESNIVQLANYSLAANVLIGDRLSQNQTYHVENSNLEIMVHERASFIDHQGMTAQCMFSASPLGFSQIIIKMNNGTSAFETIVSDIGDTHASVKSTTKTTQCAVERNNGIDLFDGPNPLFDYVNAIYLLGLTRDHPQKVTVNVIDWVNGNIVNDIYSYEWSGEMIIIEKPLLGLYCKLELSDEDWSIRHYQNAQEEYFFRDQEA